MQWFSKPKHLLPYQKDVILFAHHSYSTFYSHSWI